MPTTLQKVVVDYVFLGRFDQEIRVVYHLIRKPGWSTGVANGKRQNPNGNFHTGFAVPFTVAGFCRVNGTMLTMLQIIV